MISISDYRKMLYINRIPGVYKTRNYNLAEHSYFVAILFIRFAKEEGFILTSEMIEAVLNHDVVETITADLPHHVKNHSQVTKDAWASIEAELVASYPEFSEYADEALDKVLGHTHRLFKACDILELYIFCTEERVHGNKNPFILKVLNKCKALLDKELAFKSISEFLEEELNEIG
jgi:5'-deoxynucleotidase YfbR-like HD superfamily hydrolase